VEPRGLPEDASAYVRYSYWDSDRGEKRDSWHSDSWLMVEELTAFDYERTLEYLGQIFRSTGARTTKDAPKKLPTKANQNISGIPLVPTSRTFSTRSGGRDRAGCFLV